MTEFPWVYTSKPKCQYQPSFGSVESFNKRQERDALFAKDLKTVLDFYESLPQGKTFFQSKEERARFERLLLQRDFADYSQRHQKGEGLGGQLSSRVLRNARNQAGISPEKQLELLRNSVQKEGLSFSPDASFEELSDLLGRYRAHEYAESIGNTYGVGEPSDQAKQDAQAVLRGSISFLASSIDFCKTDPEMKKIVSDYHLLTNPTAENFRHAIAAWDQLFQSPPSSGSQEVRFAARTAYYGKRRYIMKHVLGIAALSIVGAAATSAIPAIGFVLCNSMNQGYVLQYLRGAYKLNIDSPILENEMRKLKEFNTLVAIGEKVLSHGIGSVAGIVTFGAGLFGFTALCGALAQIYILIFFCDQMAKYSKRLFDTIEDYPRFTINQKLLEPEEVKAKLAQQNKKGLEPSVYELYQKQEYTAKQLEDYYKQTPLLPRDEEDLFHTINKVDRKKEPTPLLRHILHLSKNLNPDLQIEVPFQYKDIPLLGKLWGSENVLDALADQWNAEPVKPRKV